MISEILTQAKSIFWLVVYASNYIKSTRAWQLLHFARDLTTQKAFEELILPCMQMSQASNENKAHIKMMIVEATSLNAISLSFFFIRSPFPSYDEEANALCRHTSHPLSCCSA